MTTHDNAFYLVKKDSDNVRAICKQTPTSKVVCRILCALSKTHACELFHARMTEKARVTVRTALQLATA